MDFQNYWNETHKKYYGGQISYDDWLDKYASILTSCNTPILDLGCGLGNDTKYLLERGYDVISCDYSEEALNIVKEKILNAKTMLVDISNKLPFDDETFDLVIADLSLHYFDDKTTKYVMTEIKRILSNNGTLIARVNSIDDINYGASSGEKIEENYYFVDGYKKRFFNEEDIKKYFSIIGETHFKKELMKRYSKPKETIEIVSQKNDI